MRLRSAPPIVSPRYPLALVPSNTKSSMAVLRIEKGPTRCPTVRGSISRTGMVKNHGVDIKTAMLSDDNVRESVYPDAVAPINKN